MTNNLKICPEHLARPAIVYVRQSTLGQVRHHQESRRRQYELAEHAHALGWHEVIVIDEDLGKSGALRPCRLGPTCARSRFAQCERAGPRDRRARGARREMRRRRRGLEPLVEDAQPSP
jgi:hypothetical protein